MDPPFVNPAPVPLAASRLNGVLPCAPHPPSMHSRTDRAQRLSRTEPDPYRLADRPAVVWQTDRPSTTAQRYTRLATRLTIASSASSHDLIAIATTGRPARRALPTRAPARTYPSPGAAAARPRSPRPPQQHDHGEDRQHGRGSREPDAHPARERLPTVGSAECGAPDTPSDDCRAVSVAGPTITAMIASTPISHGCDATP